MSPEWSDKVGRGTTLDWPTGNGGKGNDGVAAEVKNSEGAIGYVEYAYAKKNSIAFAQEINKDGQVCEPTIDNIINATNATLKSGFPADLKVSITNAPGASSYPICGYTYLLIYSDLSYMKDKNTALEMVKYIQWCETEGQKMAADLGYAKLPDEAQAKVIEKLKTVTFNGEPLLK